MVGVEIFASVGFPMIPDRSSLRPFTVLLLILISSRLAGPSPLWAATIHVPGDASTIQAGVDLAAGGDTVLLADGTWSGPGNRGVTVAKAVTIRSASADPADCIVDCEGAGRGFLFEGFSSAARLEAITITNGTASYGGGLAFTGVSPEIVDCRIIENTATGTGGGGGVATDAGSSPRLVRCTISGNVSSGSGGGGIWNQGGSPVFINCVVSGNSTFGVGLVGGGMYTQNGGIPLLANCAFVGNSAYDGSGIYCSFSSNPTIVNCILWGNLPGQSGDPIIEKFSAVATVTYSDVQGGFVGIGNFDSNPIFTDADGPDDIPGTADDDLRLARFSPCTDAGDNGATALAGITTDHAGQPRFVDDTGVTDSGSGDPPVIDVGPLERQTESVHLQFRVPTEVPSIQGAIDLAGLGDEIILENGVHSGPGNRDILVDLDIVIRSESGDPSMCVVDCEGSGRGFAFSGVSAAARMEGLTVTNGSADRGGGLSLTASSPTLFRCRIVSNTATGTGGGGIFCVDGSSPEILACVFRENHASGTYGGGMYNKNGSNPVLRDCIFSGNTTSGIGSTGGALYNWDSSPSLINCSVGGNSAYDGSVLFNFNNSYPEVLNSVVWGNAPGQSGYPIVELLGSATYVAYTDIQGGAPGPGNLDSDPLFLDADLRLAEGSPCIDAGYNSYVQTPTDLDGNPRTVDGDGDELAVVDMGAYERSGASTAVPTAVVLGQTSLLPPWPNPSRAEARMAFTVPVGCSVLLEILDVTGRRVRTLVAGSRGPGTHVIRWEGDNDEGRPVFAGTYFLRLSTDRGTFTQKMQRVR
jgi:hypothetical protein